MIDNQPTFELHDFAPPRETFRQDVIQGLRAPLKSIHCKYFYDEQGSRLFDQICALDEYYPTRTELAIMQAFGEEMAACVGSDCLLIEYGSGSSIKTRILLDHLREPAAYVPIDISREHLARSAAALATAYTGLQVLPVCADYTQNFTLPTGNRPASRKVVYFPGSTIGNFSTAEAKSFLARIAAVCGTGGSLLIGLRPQVVHLDDLAFPFDEGDHILTECSYKYGLDQFAQLAASAGLKVERVWTDDQHLFSVQYLTVR